MDGYIANILPGTTINCPLPECSVYVLNTPRYVPKTRVLKNTQNQEFASLQQKNVKTKRSKHVNLKDTARTRTPGIESYHQLDKSPGENLGDSRNSIMGLILKVLKITINIDVNGGVNAMRDMPREPTNM